MTAPRRVCVLGAGYFAQFQIRSWSRLDGAELVAIADRDAEARTRAATTAPGARIVDDLDALLALNPDILDIALPPSEHRTVLDAALGRVPAIICQKPFCADLAEAREIAAHGTETTLIVHENFRFQPWYREIARRLASGEAGDVVQARFALRPGDGAGPAAYLDRQPYFRTMPRFLVHETAIHFIDTFRFLFGEIHAVYADLRRLNPAIAGEDAGTILFEHASGIRTQFDGNRTLDHGAHDRRLTLGEFEVEGTRASLRLNGYGELTSRINGVESWSWIDYAFDDRDFGGDCVHLFQAHVLHGLGGCIPLETLATDYLRNLEVEAAIYRSAAEGRRILLEEAS